MNTNDRAFQIKVNDPKKDGDWWNKFLEDNPPDRMYICYKDYRGLIFKEKEGYRGKLLDIPDFVNFEGDTVTLCKEEFFKAVDDYIEFKKELNNSNIKMS